MVVCGLLADLSEKTSAEHRREETEGRVGSGTTELDPGWRWQQWAARERWFWTRWLWPWGRRTQQHVGQDADILDWQRCNKTEQFEHIGYRAASRSLSDETPHRTQKYSETDLTRLPNVQVTQISGDPSPNFWGSSVVVLGGLGVQCSRVKVVYFTPRLCRGVIACWFVPLWDNVSGSPVCWGVWFIPSPNIFGSGAVFRRIDQLAGSHAHRNIY